MAELKKTFLTLQILWISSLKKIKPVILVGIENTERRRDLTGFTTIPKDKEVAPVVGGSEKFRGIY